MEDFAIRMSAQKAGVLARLVGGKIFDNQPNYSGFRMQNTSSSNVLDYGTGVAITGFKNPDYEFCLRYIRGRKCLLTGVKHNNDYAAITTLQAIKTHATGDIVVPGSTRIVIVNCTNEASAAGDWWYCNEGSSMFVVNNDPDTSAWRIIAKSNYNNTTNYYRVCVICRLEEWDPSTGGGGGGGVTDTITFCDSITSSSGTVTFNFTTKNILVPSS